MAGKKFDITKFAATLPEAVPESGTREQIEYIDEAKLSGDGENFYSMEGIEALAQNIELVGLQQPLRVRPDPDDEGGYIVVSGHRRLTAIRTICKADEPERWRTVPCIVERGELSPAMRELRLIYANSDTRRMSNADLSAQAERVEKLLYQLQEEGVEFPGRMRDHVAEVCQISKSKLARLKVIREGLSKSEQIAKAWEKGELPEAAALEIARMDDETQYRLLDWMIDNGRSYSIKDVQEFVKSREAGAQASEDEKYIELLTHMRDSLEQTLRDCADRQTGILALKKRFRWAGGGSSEGGFNGTSKGLELYGEDGKRILRPWATVWDMLAAMRLQDGPAPTSKAAEAPPKKAEPKSGAEKTPTALVWHEPDVKPPEGAHIVFIDENGVADEDVYVSGRLKSGWADWEEVVLWTLYPDDPAQPETASEPEWLPLDAEHWPTEGALVVLSYETGLGGSSYLVARCAGGADDEYPFISTDAGTTVDDIVECRCDRWMPLAECRRGGEGS